MKEIQGGSRVGVPQGPAYARVLAELYLDNIVEKVCTDMEKGEYRILRYVDDIVVFSRDEETAYKLYQALIAGFARASLPLNRNKTRFPQKSQILIRTIAIACFTGINLIMNWFRTSTVVYYWSTNAMTG